MRRRAGAVVGAVLLVLGAGCGDGGGEPPPPDGTASEPFSSADDEASGAWLTSSDPVETGGLIWAGGPTVHLADGDEIDVGSPVRGYVVAGDGVYFFPAEDEDDIASTGIAGQELFFADRDGEVSQTGVSLMTDTLRASPDGRYLAGIDADIGEQDAYGTPLATARVFDLQTGQEIVRSSEGMGDTGEDDLSVLYENVTLDVDTLTNDTAYIEGATDRIAYDLPTGEGRIVPDVQVPHSIPDDVSALKSPNGAWTITKGNDLRDTLVSREGRRVTPRTGTGRWLLDWWVDERTAVGIAVDGPGSGPKIEPGDRLTLMSCVVPSGRCDVLEQSTGQLVVFALGASFQAGYYLTSDPEQVP